MGIEIDLLRSYPKTKRNPAERAAQKNEEDRRIARKFGKEYFDGYRRYGYGGYTYQPRFWQPVIPTFIQHFCLTQQSSVLDVGCAKGFMLHDLSLAVPGITLRGIDISEYAIENAIKDLKSSLQLGNAKNLPGPDNSFDVIISINTIHNLNREECSQALCEIERVGRGRSYITVDAYRNEEERILMEAWNLTALTFMHVDEWKAFFKEAGYTGDYYWFIP